MMASTKELKRSLKSQPNRFLMLKSGTGLGRKAALRPLAGIFGWMGLTMLNPHNTLSQNILESFPLLGEPDSYCLEIEKASPRADALQDDACLCFPISTASRPIITSLTMS